MRPLATARTAAWHCAMLLSICGCAGYQTGVRSLFRPDLRTVHVPVFESDSSRRGLGERLTEAVIREIEQRSPYKVVSTPDADSVLMGRIISESKQVLAENVNADPRAIVTDLVAQVTWYDRRGDLLMQESNFVLSPLSLAATQNVDFVPAAGQTLATAHQESLQRLAREIVSQMESPW